MWLVAPAVNVQIWILSFNQLMLKKLDFFLAPIFFHHLIVIVVKYLLHLLQASEFQGPMSALVSGKYTGSPAEQDGQPLLYFFHQNFDSDLGNVSGV